MGGGGVVVVGVVVGGTLSELFLPFFRKGVYSKTKEFAPLRSKFFPLGLHKVVVRCKLAEIFSELSLSQTASTRIFSFR